MRQISRMPKLIMPRKYILLLCFFPTIYSIFYDNKFASETECRCKRSEKSECCSTSHYEIFNSEQIFSRIKKITSSNFFRFYKVNLYNDCQFWKNEHQCVLKNCNVDTCSENELPPAFKKGADNDQEICSVGSDLNLHNLDLKIGEEQLKIIENWNHGDLSLDFVDVEGYSTDLQYVDLLKNPERYTGFAGQGAEKIWSTIYRDSCFLNRKDKKTGSNIEKCVEFEKFFIIISGFHTSVNIHASSEYPLETDESGTKWGINFQEMNRRFSDDHTNKQGSKWISNLFFLHMIVSRSILKAKVLWETNNFATGNEMEDIELKRNVIELTNILENSPGIFNEMTMFKDEKTGAEILEEIRQSFLRISKVMDCVACDKCRLWGKTQTHGLGTALKILFTPHNGRISEFLSPALKIKRMDIVSLFNVYSRLSSSLNYLHIWRHHLDTLAEKTVHESL